MRKILGDIRKECMILLHDYDKSELKNATAYSRWNPNKLQYQYSEEEIRKNRIAIALDFYERFCTQIEHMILLPNKDGILFYGP